MQYLERNLTTPNESTTLDTRSKFLKGHLPDGRMVLFRSWYVDENERVVAGPAVVHTADRRSYEMHEEFVLSFDSVSLFETNRVIDAGSGLWVATVIWGAATIICLASPKTCFGSCPTFYVSDGSEEQLMAEGFSASIAPALEDEDIDALPNAKSHGGVLSVKMTNEALETHIVRHVKLLLVPKSVQSRVFRYNNRFIEAKQIIAPISASASEGDILPVIRDEDRRERSSDSDSTDLLAREVIELEFPAASIEKAGLVLTARQSLLSTYVLYQSIAYLGESYVPTLARLDSSYLNSGVDRGRWGITVSVLDEQNRWIRQGVIHETGPLAPETHLLPFSQPQSGPLRVRMEFGKGHWRIDRVALAELGKQIDPLVLEPETVRTNGSIRDDLKMRLTTHSEVVVTQPGDTIVLEFRIPHGAESYEYFLASRGYYFEWMRDEWLKDENPQLALMLFTHPEMMMRFMAPGYKKIEKDMEKLFWRSRYAGQKN